MRLNATSRIIRSLMYIVRHFQASKGLDQAPSSLQWRSGYILSLLCNFSPDMSQLIFYQTTLMRNTASWLLVCLAIISQDDHVLITLLCSLTTMARILSPEFLYAQPAQKVQHLRISWAKQFTGQPYIGSFSVAPLIREAHWRTSAVT
jgi:hypothetical protein